MEFSVTEQIVRVSIITLTGRVDAFTVAPLREGMEKLLDNGACNFIVDLTAVLFMDSAGMAVLVTLLKRARSAGGDVRLVWPESATARRILDLTKFDRVFRMTSSVEDALPTF